MKMDLRHRMPEDLKKLDDVLLGLARKAKEDYDPNGTRLERLVHRMEQITPEARIITMAGKESAPRGERAGFGKKVWLLPLIAAALCLLAYAGFQKISSTRLGLMEYRSGLTTIMRSGQTISSTSVKNVRTGDLLETYEGNLAAILDNRVQLLINKKTVVYASGKDMINLRRGEVWLHVIPGSGDYTVEVPGGSVHIVGTSFGVRVDPQGLEVKVSTGRVILRIVKEDTEIKAGELLSLPEGKALSDAEKIRNDRLTRAPAWVESMINDMARDRLREFFPSAVPIDSNK